jgi:hypothetical protein
MTNSESVQDSLNKAVLNKKITRWLPRLTDDSSDVREEAAEILSKIALSQPELRDSLVPLLLRHCLTETSWPVICNSILFNLSSIPERDSQWLEIFLDTYIELAKTSDNFVFCGDVVREHALSNIWDLIEEKMVGIDHPKMKNIALVVESRLSREGGKVATGGEKKYLLKIQDWIEDS